MPARSRFYDLELTRFSANKNTQSKPATNKTQEGGGDGKLTPFQTVQTEPPSYHLSYATGLDELSRTMKLTDVLCPKNTHCKNGHLFAQLFHNFYLRNSHSIEAVTP
jgi:hypothetical protein